MEEDNVDLDTVIQASQSISREIEGSKLGEVLMKLMIVSAGANRAVLIRFDEKKDPVVYSEIFADSIYQPIVHPIPIVDKGKDVCLNIIKYVMRTKSQVLIHDAEKDQGSFQNDPYFLWRKPKAILCFPLLQKSELKGIIYLENTNTANAFLPSHLQLLSILSSQMVISLENAEFYGKLEEMVKDRTEELNEKNVELKESNSQLEEAFNHIKDVHQRMIQQEKMASLGMLTAGIAHELKNPLNFVINFSQIAKDNLQNLIEELDTDHKDECLHLQQELLDNLKVIDNQGHRADKIIKDMLSHVRDSGGKREEARLNDLLEEATKLSYQAFQKKEGAARPVEFKKNLAKDLPVFLGYPGDLMRVFINILDNAFFAVFMKQKSANADFKPEVEISSHVEDNAVVVKLRDNGTGIPQELLDKVYNPFFTTKDAGTGTGLGLWIAFDVITKKHNGSITVKSESGQFTEFEIKIPMKKDNERPS